ncbi:ATP-binding cassette domain-containing protein [Tunicatimonas pelagia]|uniref:ATP-binding cassette domain-containing protein n=1 Tax=Tunicatimonas pelagia TaxID=931531 RepID=UPI0026657F88|nr:ATP-binding cassette domain-containing protein [Tunicatimonas pelagia]WKN42547.1 ATP-binding cassette domain-containing protein [Tunicatimonas pelagia]
MINISEVSKKYGNKRVLDRISLQVDRGQTLVLLGTSGSGKTTLLKMINHLVPPTTGDIYIDGKAVGNSNPTQLRKAIGYVIQQVGLFPHYTNRHNIELTLRLNNWPEKQREERSSTLLKLVGLNQEDGERYPHELSGGQQQRVGIARALANDPPIILMDEPFGALDPITKQNLIAELVEKQLFKDKTVVIVTHDVFEAIILADKICLLDQGQVQQIGSPKELLFQPASKFVKAFFDAQRLRLEMQVVNLAEVYPLIKVMSEKVSSTVEISLEKSVWEALEAIERNNMSQIFLTNGQSIKKIVSPTELVEAFYQFKNNNFTPAVG